MIRFAEAEKKLKPAGGWRGQRVFFFQTWHTNFYYEDALQNLTMFASTNKHKNMYLISAKTEGLSTNSSPNLIKYLWH